MEDTLKWFKAAVPEPNKTNKRVQLGCLLEEVVELLGSFSISGLAETSSGMATTYLNQVAEALKKGYAEIIWIDHKEFLDALCDIQVTLIGSAYMQGMDIEGAMKEVNRSNFSKFEDGKPVFNESGKIAKGKNYSPPDLTPYV